MKFTNKFNVPSEIIRAYHNDKYSKGDSDFSITGLITPPQQRVLKEMYRPEITIDYSDEIWKLLGSGIHAVIERANENYTDNLTEQRFTVDILGKKVSGQIDNLNVPEKKLEDWKVTSSYTVKNAIKNGIKSEWVSQLNCYKYLYEKSTGKKIDQLNIICLCRDWNRWEFERSGSPYPECPIATLPVEIWETEKTEKFLTDRVALHKETDIAVEMGIRVMPVCTDEERWMKPDEFRVTKKGRKSAMRRLPSEEEANEWIKKNVPEKIHKDISIVFIKGEATRCKAYCPVSNFCSQYQEEVKNSEGGEQWTKNSKDAT
jgi:hypothetical protein